MGQRYDIVASRNETYQLKLDYTDSNGTGIALDTTDGATVFTLNDTNTYSSTGKVKIADSTTSVPTNNETPGVFWFPGTPVGRVILHIPQAQFELTGTGKFGDLTLNTKYYYDIVATTTGAPILKVKLLSGYFTLTPGISDV
jgi:hypothetical protein